MALRKLLYVYMVLFFFSCNCNNAFVSDYNIYTRKNNLGDKEFRISLKGQITNLVFLPSQRGLEHKDIYLRMVSNYSTISTQQQNSNIKALHYIDIMRSIEHILSFMARDYKIENLHCLKVDISSFGEESLNLSKKYIDLYGNGNEIQSNNVSDVVEKSNLINDINRIVSVYGLSVKEVKTETPYFININDFYTDNAKTTRKNVVIPDRVLEATIYIILRKVH